MIMDISNYENWIAYFESLHKLASYSGIKLNEDLCKHKTFAKMNKYLAPYDCEMVKNQYIESLDTFIPIRNDGSKVCYAFPIKHQELRCGKWIPDEYMFFNAVRLYFDLANKELTRSFGFTPLKAYPTNIRHFFSKDDQCACDINAIAKNKITVKCNYID